MIRIGVLGAARITRRALLTPARATDGVDVRAVAARDSDRASAYASKYGLEKVHPSYEALLNDPELDAVYIPLPASLHGEWTKAAIAADKHVLCEKPFTANAEEAAEIAGAAKTAGLVVLEAHHVSFHPFTARIREHVSSGVLGEIRSVKTGFFAPIPPSRDIRWNARLGGGALMDLGCYPVRMVRDVLGEPKVTSAVALQRDGVDRRMTARLVVDGTPVTIDCSMWSPKLLGSEFTVTGSLATMRVRGPFHPQVNGLIRIDGPGVRVRERADRTSTYRYQLEAFRDAIHHRRLVRGNPEQAVATMQVIDDIYRAAGMAPRQPFHVS